MSTIASPTAPVVDHLQRFLRLAGPIAWDRDELASCVVDAELARILHVAAMVEADTDITARQATALGLTAAPDLAAFLPVWATEEAEHGRALRALLAGRPYRVPLPPPPAISRRRRLLAGVPLGALHHLPQTELVLCALGAAGEHSALVTYTELAKRIDDPVAQRLLRAVIRQEGRHLDFFLAAAQRRATSMSRVGGRLARRAMVAIWQPAGVPSLGRDVWRDVFSAWLDDDEILARFEGMDRVVDAIPHLAGLGLMRGFLGRPAR